MTQEAKNRKHTTPLACALRVATAQKEAIMTQAEKEVDPVQLSKAINAFEYQSNRHPGRKNNKEYDPTERAGEHLQKALVALLDAEINQLQEIRTQATSDPLGNECDRALSSLRYLEDHWEERISLLLRICEWLVENKFYDTTRRRNA